MANPDISLAEQIEVTVTAFKGGLLETEAQIIAEGFAQLKASNVADPCPGCRGKRTGFPAAGRSRCNSQAL